MDSPDSYFGNFAAANCETQADKNAAWFESLVENEVRCQTAADKSPAHKTLWVVSKPPKLFSYFPTLLPYALEQKSRLKLRSVIK